MSNLGLLKVHIYKQGKYFIMNLLRIIVANQAGWRKSAHAGVSDRVWEHKQLQGDK